MSVELKGARVSYERWGESICPFDGLDLSIAPGEWVMLAGPNGSGKTTLLRAMAGTQQLDRGRIELWGVDPGSATAAQRTSLVYSVSQNPLAGTASDLTEFENLYLADDCPHRPRAELMERYGAMLQPLGLRGQLTQRLTTLSGGQRQLLAIVMAGLRQTRLVLLDEPLAALDPSREQLALDCIRALWCSGKTIVQVTHDPHLMVSEGTRTLVLADGHFVYDQYANQRDKNGLRDALASARQMFS